MKHLLPDSFRRNPVTIDLVGVGGTGSRLLTALAELHVALIASGHKHGLHVTAWDPKRVSGANIGRTSFAPSDIGKLKSTVLVTRINTVYGLAWRSFGQPYQHPYWHMERAGAAPDFVITATDSLRSRAELYRQMLTGETPPPRYWLDCGNAEETGQIVMGEPEWLGDPNRFLRRPRLRHLVDLFPGMLEEADREEPEPPSCTLAIALGMQGLSVNRLMADWAQTILWRFFRDGALDWHGAFINARTGRVNPLPVDPAAALREIRPEELVSGRTLQPATSRPVRRRLRTTGNPRRLTCR